MSKNLLHGNKVMVGDKMYMFTATPDAITCDGCDLFGDDNECHAPASVKCQGSWKLGLPSGVLKEL